jgi:sulfate adenylyltransferase
MLNKNENIITPYGDSLVDLSAKNGERAELISRLSSLPKIVLSQRNVCDFELLATGAFSPVDSFLGKNDYENVLERMRLANGKIFPVPITLSVNQFEGLRLDGECTLVDRYDNPLGIIRVEEIYDWDWQREAFFVCGTKDSRHPLVAEMQSWGKYNVSGKITALNLPRHYDFEEFRLTPSQVREMLQSLGKNNVVAFQTRNPLHRAHEEMIKRAAGTVDGALLLHPVVGVTQRGDIEYIARVRSYKKLIEKYYKENTVLFALLPLAMRMAGPREALWHAVIRRNFGANHLIIGRYHATPNGGCSNGDSFYGAYDAHELMLNYEQETGVKPILFSEFVYLPGEDRYEEIKNIDKHKSYFQLSGTEIRNRLKEGRSIPEWQLRPETAEILKENQPTPKAQKQGFCIWLTGLSGAGKSTIANLLVAKLSERGRQATLLDGDVVRTNLSKGLGFSKKDRDINVRRIGFVASQIVKHGEAVICAAISPYRSTRNECRLLIGDSSFVEIFVNTPLEVCEERDVKGLYSLARSGKLKNFTGIDDPYEEPSNPEIRVETVGQEPEFSAEKIIEYLIKKGLIPTG